MSHRLKHFRVTGNWTYGEELQRITPQTSDHDQTNKDWQAISFARRTIRKDKLNTARDTSPPTPAASMDESKTFTVAIQALT
jgi:hypothetical protein